MTYKFGANRQCARRVDTVLPNFLDSANEVLSDEVTTLEEHREIFPLLMGWWLFTRSTAAAMIHLYRQGFTVEVKPLARNLFAHAFAMSWLVDNGPAAVQAVHTYLGKQEQSFTNNLVEIKYPLPEPPRKVAPPVFQTLEEHRWHEKLVGEITYFANMVAAYNVPMAYPLYRMHSAYAHTSAQTANAFITVGADGRVGFTAEATEDTLTDQVYMAVSVFTAAQAIGPTIKGDPMRKPLEKAMGDLGISGDLRPRRKSCTAPRPQAGPTGDSRAVTPSA
ncbi:hypothetical protein Scani_48370 [Streptomyces caniferus]|uniref:Uncharacterized protein n=1 Tax=Streptomyces caniferus TaxID=285557 RepID=A0A640SB96_9ACTN|nr:DUF5677 domain-containing protein [Streptomyces caniferus]GFE08569.1 hypothetical protein Scani_48370 [Streptomyces caniferus]